MRHNFDKSVEKVLKHEGGWSDHPKDPGGATNMGVTIATFRRYVKKNATKKDLKNMTMDQAKKVYKKHYWDKVKADMLPDGLDHAVFDFAVNSGPTRAIKFMQRSLGVEDDGQIGAITIQAADEMDAKAAVNILCDARLAFLKRLRTWDTFGKGWGRRVERVRKESEGFALQPPKTTEPAPEKLQKPRTEVQVEPKTRSKTLIVAVGLILIVLAVGYFLTR